ncbi:mediator of RNA polymerase II transcription subunit 1 isoform X1 [Hydra vulgaris]|uniref:mediator of RNA polymerase II transcription subunit 1 isoform X1 n=1 Tax=Hydra vulgaris TaxID=6087 RepID=UPI001F5E8CE0|nr:mediator of RNA polymerase II transcription subunit 1-like [Hydra vulgaris]
MKDITIEVQIKQLRDILQNIKNIIPDEKKQFGENLHGFGPCLMHTEQIKAMEIIGILRNKYKSFLGISNPQLAMKLVAEKQALSNICVPVSNMLHKAINDILKKTRDSSLDIALHKLESIAINEGLACEISNNDFFISSEMFYVEVKLNHSGEAEYVNIHNHMGELKPCKELVNCLKKKDYDDFLNHLRGLKEIYALVGDSSTKAKIVSAVGSLEEDLLTIMNSDSSIKNQFDCIMRGPVGCIIPAVGGKCLQSVFFMDPLMSVNFKSDNYQGLDMTKGCCSAVLSAQSTEQNLLPTSSVLMVENNNIQYQNEQFWTVESLPATFVLKLLKPLPASIRVAKLIHNIIKKDKDGLFVHNSKIKFDQLLLKETCGEMKDVLHCCALPDFSQKFEWVPSDENDGLLLSLIPFTKPNQIISIIKVLRFQAIYNHIFTSFLCGAPTKKESNDIFVSVSASDWNTIRVSFLYNVDSSLASVDITISMEGTVDCTLNVLPGSPNVCTNVYLTKILNKCLSLPLLMRSLFKKVASYKPEHLVEKPPPEKKAQRPKKLLMPNLSQIQSELPLVSPHINSPSNFLNFSGSVSSAGISPHTPLFPFDGQRGVSQKKTFSMNSIGTPVSLGTPNSDGSGTPNKLKLPKITLKRKRNNDSEIYEIDQTKTIIDQDCSISNQSNDESMSYVYPPFDSINYIKVPSLFPEQVSFPDIPIDSDTDIEGLFGISSFSVESQGSTHVPAFDLDTITSGLNSNFEQHLSASAIDPSSLIGSSSGFHLDGIIDIDSLMSVDT